MEQSPKNYLGDSKIWKLEKKNWNDRIFSIAEINQYIEKNPGYLSKLVVA